MSAPSHVPVLLDRVVSLLAPALERDGAVLVDATLGLGGHSEAVLIAAVPIPARGPEDPCNPNGYHDSQVSTFGRAAVAEITPAIVIGTV